MIETRSSLSAPGRSRAAQPAPLQSSPFLVTAACPRSSVAGGNRCRYPVKFGKGVLRQVEVGRCDILLQAAHLLRAWDGYYMFPLRQRPGYGDLRRRRSHPLGDILHRLHDAAVSLHGLPAKAQVVGAKVVLVKTLAGGECPGQVA